MKLVNKDLTYLFKVCNCKGFCGVALEYCSKGTPCLFWTRSKFNSTLNRVYKSVRENENY